MAYQNVKFKEGRIDFAYSLNDNYDNIRGDLENGRIMGNIIFANLEKYSLFLEDPTQSNDLYLTKNTATEYYGFAESW